MLQKQQAETGGNTSNTDNDDELTVDLNTDDNLDDEQTGAAGADDDQGGAGNTDDQGTDDEDEVVVTIDGVTPDPEQEEQASAPQWVKDVRKQNRELARQNRELQDKLNKAATPAPAAKPAELGPKPTLADHDYDADAFEAALEKWHSAKRDADAASAASKAAQDAEAAAWQAKLTAYDDKKKALKVKDFDDAEAAVQDTFDTTQRGVLIHGSEDPALLVYALGKNPGKAKELAAITDPVKFAFAVARLETQLKVTNRKAAPPAPERSIQGSGRASGAVDSTLERLRAEADRTGDMTKVMAYKRQLKAKAGK